MRLASAVIGSYLLGCVVAAYYIVRIRAAADIRALGSGNVGSRNVARVAGKNAALLTFALDATKGALAVCLTHSIAPQEWAVGLSFIAVIAGHIWPVQLAFHGGRGAATGLGGLLAADWRAVALGSVVLAIVWAFSRQQTAAAMAGFAVTPIFAFFFGASVATAATLAIGCALIMIAHHSAFDRWRQQRVSA